MLRWIRVGVAATAVYLFIRHAPIWTAILALVLLLISFLLEAVGEKSLYVEFKPSGETPPDPAPLRPEEKVHIRATGQFEVEGKRKKFANLEAYFRTFNNREHAIMAWVPASRYLLVGKWPEEDLGLWYIFFKYDQMVELVPGTVIFSGESKRCLRIRHIDSEKEKPKELSTFLSFSTEEEMRAVWADLLWDGSKLLGFASQRQE